MTTRKPRTDDVDAGGMSDILVRIFGEKVWDDDVSRTAQRWLKAMQEFTPQKVMPFKFTTFPKQASSLITVCDIEFASLCAHHLFPFVGKCHVGYIPNKRQVGLSKIPRLVHWLATRPSSQERLTAEIAHTLKDQLEAMGVAVVVEATHTCMSARGVREHNGVMRTSEMLGIFLTASEARAEFLAMIARSQ